MYAYYSVILIKIEMTYHDTIISNQNQNQNHKDWLIY